MPPLPFPGELFQENERKLQIVFKKFKFKGQLRQILLDPTQNWTNIIMANLDLYTKFHFSVSNENKWKLQVDQLTDRQTTAKQFVLPSSNERHKNPSAN